MVDAHPDSDALHRQAAALMGQRRYAEAAERYTELCRRRPDDVQAWFFLGTARCAMGDMGEGSACFERTLALQPEHVDAHINKGNALFCLGRYEEALAAYGEVLRRRPNHGAAHNNRAHVLARLGRGQEAEDSYRAAIAADHSLVDAYYNLGNLQVDAHRFQEAEASYRQALALKPDLASCRNNLGRALYMQGRHAAAIEQFEQAIRLAPNNARHLVNMAAAWRERDDLARAEAALEKALQLAPADDVAVSAWTNLATIRNSQGRTEETVEMYHRILAVEPTRADVASALLGNLHYLPGYSPAELLDEARRWWPLPQDTAHARPATPHTNAPQPRRRLRVGYVSGDFHKHPVAYFLEPVMAHYDRADFELFCYYNNTIEDDQTQLIRSHSGHWRDVAALSDLDLAECIRADGIDVLVDLSGHTVKNRLPVFALRPAPVQMTWLGYYGTTAAAGVDYIIGDPYVTPPGSEAHYTEQVLRLPHCYSCFGKPHFDLPVSPPPGDPARGLVLGGFHNPPKVTAPVIALWSRLLHALPQAQLYLKYRWFGDAGVRERFLAAFAAHGIGPERLRIEGFAPRRELLAAYGGVDLALDTFPYNGGTTTVEALWMGVPVVSLRGERFVNRVGASILTTVGLDELIADSEDDYAAKVVALVSDTPRLRALRETLRERVLASPLFDGERFTRGLERLYRDAWTVWCARHGGA